MSQRKRKPEPPKRRKAGPTDLADQGAPDSRSRWWLSLAIVAIGIVVMVVHWPALSAEATFFDDKAYFLENPLVRNPGWDSVGRFLVEMRNPSTLRGYYQPLTMISLMIDAALGARPEDLRVVHQTSLLLHVANTCLLAVLIFTLLGRVWPAVLVGLLFGVHPMTVETIAWIGERKTVLATFFALWSLIAYVQYARHRRGAWYLACCGAFVLALLSKPTVTPLPILLLILDFWPLERLGKKAAIEKIPLFAVAAASGLVTIVSQAQTYQMSLPREYGVGQTLLLVLRNLSVYPARMLWPAELSSVYPFPESLSLADPSILAAVTATLMTIVLLALSLRWTRVLVAGWLFYAIALSPTFFNVGYALGPIADKYAYLPSFGLLLILAYGLNRLWAYSAKTERTKWARFAVVGIVLLLVAAETRATRRYLHVWRDSRSLYQHMVSVAPTSSVLHNNLAGLLLAAGDESGAIRHYREAIRLHPAWKNPPFNLGIVLADQKDLAEAADLFRRAIEIDPRYTEAYVHLARTLLRLQENAEALEHAETAVNLDPDSADARNILANALFRRGAFDRAISEFRRALELRPDYKIAAFNLGTLLAQQGDFEGAVKQFRRVVKLDPNHARAHNRLGYAQFELGRVEAAIDSYQRAIKLDPDYAEALNNLGHAMQHQGEHALAIRLFDLALQHKPGMDTAWANLGVSQAALGKVDEAAESLRQALRLNPRNEEAGTALEELTTQPASAPAIQTEGESGRGGDQETE